MALPIRSERSAINGLSPPATYLGPGLGSVFSSTTRNLNSATNAVVNTFHVPRAMTLSEVWVWVNGVTGTVTNIGTIELTAAAADGTPTGSVLESKSFTPAASSWIQTTGWTTALTAGSDYCLSVVNDDAAPASNWFSTHHQASTTPGSFLDVGRHADGGSWTARFYSGSWTSIFNRAGNMIAKMSDGSHLGGPFHGGGADTASDLYGSSRALVVGTPIPGPASLQYRVVAVRVGVTDAGTPAGSLGIRVYPGTPKALTPSNAPLLGGFTTLRGSATTNGYSASMCEEWLQVPLWVSGGSVVQVEFTGVNNANAANSHNLLRTWLLPSGIPRADLCAMMGIAGQTAVYCNGSSTTDVGADYLYCVSLVLDSVRLTPSRSRRWH